MRKFFLILLSWALTSLFFIQSSQASITQETDGNGVTWYIITAGNDFNTLLTGSATSPMNIRASRDLTLPTSPVTIPNGLTLTIDMNNFALYSCYGYDSIFHVGTNQTIRLANMQMTATGNNNELVNNPNVPKPDGTMNGSVRYNYYYGLFYSADQNYSAGSKLTYQNVQMNLGSITTWGGSGGQPFYTRGLPVNFSGNNYFNFPAGRQELMEGQGFSVLDGTTQITGSGNSSYVPITNGTTGSVGGISVNAGAQLTVNLPNQTGTFFNSNGHNFSLINQGNLQINLANITNFMSGTTDTPIAYTFGPSSSTNISTNNLFNYATTNPVNTLFDNHAQFTYTSLTNAFWYNNPDSNDSFTIKNADRVRFNTQNAGTPAGQSAVFRNSSTGGNTSMPITISTTSPLGYDITGYALNGNPLIGRTTNSTNAAFGVVGSFYPSLGNLVSGLTTGPDGQYPTSTGVQVYQSAPALEFTRNVGMLTFASTPLDTALTFNYQTNMISPGGSLLPRNGTNNTMDFVITDSRAEMPNFSVQASIVSDNLPTGMALHWLDSGNNNTLSATPFNIFTQDSPLELLAPFTYRKSYQADQGVQLQLDSPAVQKGTYNATIQWNLVDGPN